MATVSQIEGLGSVRTCCVDSVTYYCGSDVGEALDYSIPHKAIRENVRKEDTFSLSVLLPDSYLKRGSAKYINKAGLQMLVMKSQKPGAIKAAQALGFGIDTKYVRKEQEIVKYLQEFLDELKVAVELQKCVGQYRVDAYLPDYKLALEIDENNLSNRDPLYERNREEFVKRSLGCTFMRVNPDAKGFRLCAQLSERIFSHHMRK